MNRLLKFRVWQDYRNEPETNLGLGFFEFDLNNKDDCQMFANEYNDSVTISICQFTGFIDKNGEEIYEGDIVRTIDYFKDKRESLGRVQFGKYEDDERYSTWNHQGFYLQYIDYEGDTDKQSLHNFNIEVVGNIYQNPGWLGEGIRVIDNKHENPDMVKIMSNEFLDDANLIKCSKEIATIIDKYFPKVRQYWDVKDLGQFEERVKATIYLEMIHSEYIRNDV